MHVLNWSFRIISEKETEDIFSSDDPMLRLPPRMSEWTKDDVRIWLKGCTSVSEHQADLFAEKVRNGNSLISYQGNLQKEFGFTGMEVNCFVSSRDDWLSNEIKNKDCAFSRVSKTGEASTLRFQVNAIYNINLNNANNCIVFIDGGDRLGTGGLPFAGKMLSFI